MCNHAFPVIDKIDSNLLNYHSHRVIFAADLSGKKNIPIKLKDLENHLGRF